MFRVGGRVQQRIGMSVADNITGTQYKSDRELLGQGLGNALAGLFENNPLAALAGILIKVGIDITDAAIVGISTVMDLVGGK